MATESAVITKKSCRCYHCKKDGFSRRELDAHFLCVTCRATPGVKGYRARLPATGYGSPASSKAYWEATKDQLNIVGEDEALPNPKATLRQWQFDVLADPELSAETKVALVRLSMFGDWKTGANCRPSWATLARMAGSTEKRARNAVAEGARRGYVAVQNRQLSGRGKTTNLYQFRWPDGRELASEPTAPSVQEQGRATAPRVHERGSRSSEPTAPSVLDQGSDLTQA